MKAIPTVTEAMHCPVCTQIATTLSTVVAHLGSPAAMAMAVETETAEGTGTVAETKHGGGSGGGNGGGKGH